MTHAMMNSSVILGVFEIPFLVLAIVYALRTAGALRGGIFGRGMGLIALGLIVMAIGHILMMIDMTFGTNLLSQIFGVTLGAVMWVVALIASWVLVGTGFHSIYKASRA